MATATARETKKFTMPMDLKLHETLEAAADIDERSMSALVRVACKEWIARNRKRLKLAGMPSDLLPN